MQNGTKTRPRRRTAGFTLVEIMVVVVILGILASVVVVNIHGHADKAKREAARSSIQSILQAVQLFKLDTGKYPSTSEGLEALVKDPGVKGWKEGGYISGGRVPKDPWGNDFIYIHPGHGNQPDIVSYGADGREGGSGIDADIESWQLDAE
ncbi:MAG: type II secretion system major pseudopilin GspG [Planctomycetota bacterium]